jgi:S1-C subfamily serine protease
MQGAAIIPTQFPRFDRWRASAFLAMLIAAALLAIVLAYWAWQWFGPARVHIAPAVAPDPAATLIASGLFNSGALPTAPSESMPVLSGDARLLGVFAEAGDRGYALFRLPSGAKLVTAGQEISPGATLAAVRPDSIDVREAAGVRGIALRAAPAKAVPAATISKATSARVACAPPAGFKGLVVALNTELVGGLMAQPESWRALVEPVNGALTVRDESGFAAMLGLKRGDRIAQANGIALTVPEDVIGAVLRPLASNQPVRLTGTRDGQPRELWLRSAACG